jgi:MFS family permease
MTYAYALVFLLNGATWGGLWIGITNYVLDISPHDIRPLFLGLTATLSLPTALMPLVGGWLLGFISYEALFAITVVGGLAALVYALRLETPPTLHEA